jgi:hypothetical protein
MFQVKAQTMKGLTKANRREFNTQLKEVKSWAERDKGTGNCADAGKQPKFDGKWAVSRRQFQTVAEHKCWKRLKKSTT